MQIGNFTHFPEELSRIQGWMPSAPILPATLSPEIRFVPMTGLTTVAPSPVREALRFASIAPHNLPCRRRSRNVSARGLHFWRHGTKTQLPIPVPAARLASVNTGIAGKSGSTRGT